MEYMEAKGVARTLKNTYINGILLKQTVESLQMRPFSKWELLFKSSSFWYGKSLLPH